ncbi:hypothetical protein GQ53DRAFT_747926 [Thozetella sp. PMI_491]|nr:hypothetical protein GQ53DRAFT_747926 [Thozetella sp. PMI_491]
MADLSSGVSKLSLKNDRGNAPKPKKPPVVADSWEDEDVSSGSEAEEPAARAESKEAIKPGTAAPPPTPITANYTSRPFSPEGASVPESAMYSGHDGPPVEKARPEKTDAVARRMIASALGVKVPKLTEEQRAYDKAMREKERKRREEEKVREKQREEEAAKARTAVWDD